VSRALLDTQHAFDGVAPSYAESNAANTLLCAMRARTRWALERFAAPASHILNLGCGPGTDDLYFAARGHRVSAIDASPAMVEQARRAVAAAGFSDRVSVETLAIDHLHRFTAGPFDAAYSAFGPLNCAADLPAAARLIAERVRPGGVVVASVIGRICPWEIALYAARGDFRRVAVRFRRGLVAVPLEGRTVWMRYYTPRTFTRAFTAAGFRCLEIAALGLLTPPPYMDAFARRHQTSIAGLQQLEDSIGGWPIVRGMGDHFLAVLRRT
jgi:SAM-dependent methyltransferase